MKTQKYFTVVYSLLCFVYIPICLYGQVKDIKVDAGDVIGEFEMIVGTHGKPTNHGIEFLDSYKNLGFDFIRNHDYYGPTDWYTIFPDWNADAEKESSYSFKSSDSIILSIKNSGLDVFFRLGSSWKGKNKLPVNDPPGTLRNSKGKIVHAANEKDFKKFAQICKHIVMHYNNGWANGYYLNIKKWEIWNEPSYSEQFWNGDYRQFRVMFAEVSKTLKKFDNSLFVGGPGQVGMDDEPYFVDSLFSYCSKEGAHIDFYSFHTYGGRKESLNPYEVVEKQNRFRKSLNKFGYEKTYLICSEYNCGPQGIYSNTTTAAAFVGAFLTYSEMNGIKESYFYRADDHPMGLIGMKNGKLKAEGYSFMAWKKLKENCLKINATGGDYNGFTVIASKDKISDKVYILISNFPSNKQKINLSISNLKAVRYNITLSEISDKAMLKTTVEKNIQVNKSESEKIKLSCDGNSIMLVELSAS